MLLTPMRYKDYIWPYNPATYSIAYERQIAVHKAVSYTHLTLPTKRLV